jgi:hypothetical protein
MNEAKYSGFVIKTAKEVETFKKAVKEIDSEVDFEVDEQESASYEDGEEFLSRITFSEITEEELAVIKKFLGESGGMTYFWKFIMEEIDEYEEEEEE